MLTTRPDDLNDPLDDIFGGPVTGEKPRPTPPATYKPADFTEKCQKCRGSGRFVTYTGKVLGPCHACKGRGQNTFKSSPEQRARNRANAAARDQRKREDAIETFKAENPAAYAWLIANVERFDFATSMWNALRNYGSLTTNQLAAIERCIARDAERKAEREARVAAAPEINIAAIEGAFADARSSGLKKLRLRLDTFLFSPAGKDPSIIYVREGDEYLGKVVGGKFQAVRVCGDERQARILAAAADPKAAAIAYGKRFGSCSCCGRELSNPESIELGIGPICAQKWGW